MWQESWLWLWRRPSLHGCTASKRQLGEHECGREPQRLSSRIWDKYTKAGRGAFKWHEGENILHRNAVSKPCSREERHSFSQVTKVQSLPLATANCSPTAKRLQESDAQTRHTRAPRGLPITNSQALPAKLTLPRRESPVCCTKVTMGSNLRRCRLYSLYPDREVNRKMLRARSRRTKFQKKKNLLRKALLIFLSIRK